MRHSMLPVLVGLLFTVGCYGTGTYATHGGVGMNAGYYGPDLAYVSPGVQVVAGYDQPVFYSDNFYWRYDNDRWFRSNHFDRGWAYATPPRAVMSIDRPNRYRNYRPNGYGYNNRSQIRDQRGNQRGPAYRQDHRGNYGNAPIRGQVRPAPVRGGYQGAPVRGQAVRQAPVRGNYGNAPVRGQTRQAPARRNTSSERSNVRSHRSR